MNILLTDSSLFVLFWVELYVRCSIICTVYAKNIINARYSGVTLVGLTSI